MIFPETFASDKPVYYPSTWGTGKTALELHEQWKLTFEYSVISNVFQIIGSTIWVFILFVIVRSAKEIWRLATLADDNREKIDNRKYLKFGFVIPAAVLAALLMILSFYLLVKDQWLRYAFFKGVLAWIVIFGIKKFQHLFTEYKRNKKYAEWQIRQNEQKDDPSTQVVLTESMSSQQTLQD